MIFRVCSIQIDAERIKWNRELHGRRRNDRAWWILGKQYNNNTTRSWRLPLPLLGQLWLIHNNECLNRVPHRQWGSNCVRSNVEGKHNSHCAQHQRCEVDMKKKDSVNWLVIDDNTMRTWQITKSNTTARLHWVKPWSETPLSLFLICIVCRYLVNTIEQTDHWFIW